jgi:hypothetical protein
VSWLLHDGWVKVCGTRIHDPASLDQRHDRMAAGTLSAADPGRAPLGAVRIRQARATASPSRRASHHEQSDIVLDAVVTEPPGDYATAGRFSVVRGHERSSYELEAFDIRIRVLVGPFSALDEPVGVESEGSPG